MPHFPVTAWRFRETRLTLALSVEACANLLHVSERTVRGWESAARWSATWHIRTGRTSSFADLR
ncbi:hypothetical protein GCM10027430_14320 [Lysobacter tyrosinilyticus]